MVSPGEAIIPAKMTAKYAPLIQGMIADNIPGFQMGKGFRNATMFLPESINTAMGQPTGRGVPTRDVAGYLGGAGGASMAPLLAVIARELKVGLNNPKFKQEFSVIANLFAKTATDALNKSGKEFIKDADLEGIVVPALREAAKGIKVAGKDIDVALENAVNQIRTVGPVGVGSGSAGSFGRVALPGSYRGARVPAQRFAAEQNPQMFASTERFSQSKQKIVKSFQTLNPALDKWETATMSHITSSVTASVDDLTRQMTPYLGDVGARITDAVTKKTIKGVVDRAKVASPSRETEMVGASIAQGFIVGAEGYVDDARVVGSKLGSGMVQTASGLFVPGGTTGQQPPRSTSGINLGDIASKARMNREILLSTQQQKRMAVMNQRMDKLNKGFMSGTFALSALSGVASMAGGNLGKFSEIIFQITGPLFALSSILQLFTGKKIVGIFAELGKLKLGLIGVGLIALGVGIKLTNDARSKELEYINGLSNAMKTTTGQVKTLGDFFGVVPRKLGFEGRNREIVGRDVRSARDTLRADSSFQKEFASTIKTLSTATAQEAQLAFTSLALNLKAQGFEEKQVQTIVDALREEAGRTDIKLDVKSLNFSAESIKQLQQQLSSVLLQFNKDFKIKPTGSQKFLSGFIGSLLGNTPKVMDMTNATKKSLSELTTFIVETAKSSEGMFKLGLISSQEYQDGLSGVLTTLNALDESARKVALLEIFKQLEIDATGLLPKLKDAKTQLMLIALLSAGEMNKDSNILKGLMSSNPGAQIVAIKELTAAYEAYLKVVDKVVETDQEGDGTGGATGEAKLNALQERIKAIKQQTQAYIILRNAKVDEATATELSNDAEIASLVLANSKGKSLKYITGLVKEYKKALAGQAKAELQYMSGPNLFQKQLERAQAQANLREKLIDMQYAPQIKKENDALAVQEKRLEDINAQIEKVTKSQVEPIQAVIDSNNLALDKIALKEDAINEKYNKQVEALDKIASINQNIANIQKQRLSIADALTRGDISTAAQLMQDARSEQAQSAVTGQKETLTATRDAAISALGRNAIEKQNKELQLQINIIEATQLKTLQAQKQTIENTIESINLNITALNKQVEVTKQGYVYAKGTKDEMDSLDSLIQLATAAGIPFNDLLLKQAGNAQALAAALSSALASQKQLGSGAKTMAEIKAGYDAGTITPQTITPEQKSVVLQSIKDLNAKIKGKVAELNKITQKKMYGGMVTKYMAFGGKAMGSDTVPAMLTPGEFVMNKGASKAYGPLLERINESKYPGMLGGGGMTQIPVNNISTSMNDNSTAVYNYNLGFSINGANGSAKDIANAVMREIKNVDSQRIRGQRR